MTVTSIYKNLIIIACNKGIRWGSLSPVAFRRHPSSSHVQASILITDAVVPYNNRDNEKLHDIDDQVVVLCVHLFGWSCVGNEPTLSW